MNIEPLAIRIMRPPPEPPPPYAYKTSVDVKLPVPPLDPEQSIVPDPFISPLAIKKNKPPVLLPAPVLPEPEGLPAPRPIAYAPPRPCPLSHI